ncbi:suppressor of fused domain protein [Longispora albida]|uniref:suppressor of fused domain protein n=1 Tax=Longispora albida TaxID=203523 RepID=UPI00047727EE|nr:suppressor of fused domain protein [Longispora albida]
MESAPQGSGILRHEALERGWTPPADSDPESLEAIDRHISQYFGEPATVWHEMASDLVHIDVHMIEPTPQRPFVTLVTSGMSDLPMNVPAEAGVSPYAELMIALPPDWPLTADAWKDECHYWPVRLLKSVARLPHEYGTWIGQWHSVPNGDPAEPYAPGVPFTGVVVTPMVNSAPEARTIVTPSGKQIALLALVPLHPGELELKLTHGTGALIEALDRVRVTEHLDPARPSGA